MRLDYMSIELKMHQYKICTSIIQLTMSNRNMPIPRPIHELTPLSDESNDISTSTIIDVDSISNGLQIGIYEHFVHTKNIKSDVWKFYRRIKSVRTNEPINFVECTKCERIVKFIKSSGTKYLWEHHKTCQDAHPIEFKKYKLKDQKNNKTSIFALKKMIIEKGTEMCAMDMTPFRMIQNKGFKSFCDMLIKIGGSDLTTKEIFPSAMTLSRNTTSLYQNVLNKLRPEISAVILKGI